jgi:hypothetical protein
MSVLTVYSALMLRWCNETELVVPFSTIGRHHSEVDNTIGFFGVPLFLRIELHEDDTFRDLLRRVTEEYRTAYEHDDECRVAAQNPGPPFAWNPPFNWIPREFNMGPAGNVQGCEVDDSIRLEPFGLEITLREDIRWDGDLRLDLSDTEDGITGVIGYRADRLASNTLQQFAQDLLRFAEELVRNPGARVTGV